jgi:hypothetical protein
VTSSSKRLDRLLGGGNLVFHPIDVCFQSIYVACDLGDFADQVIFFLFPLPDKIQGFLVHPRTARLADWVLSIIDLGVGFRRAIIDGLPKFLLGCEVCI